MTDPVTKTEIEDVLASIRRLVSVDDRAPQASAGSLQTREQDKLILTPSQRIDESSATVEPHVATDEEGDVEASFVRHEAGDPETSADSQWSYGDWDDPDENRHDAETQAAEPEAEEETGFEGHDPFEQDAPDGEVIEHTFGQAADRHEGTTQDAEPDAEADEPRDVTEAEPEPAPEAEDEPEAAKQQAEGALDTQEPQEDVAEDALASSVLELEKALDAAEQEAEDALDVPEPQEDVVEDAPAPVLELKEPLEVAESAPEPALDVEDAGEDIAEDQAVPDQAVEAAPAPEPEPEMTEESAPEPVAAPAPQSELEARIAEVEAAVAARAEEFEPDGSMPEDAFTSELSSMQWPDALNNAEVEDAELVKEEVGGAESADAEAVVEGPEAAPAEDVPDEAVPGPELEIAADPASEEIFEAEVETAEELQEAAAEALREEARAKAAAPEQDSDDPAMWASDEAILDEDALRDMVSEIVRQELQGALGERITRNVRKLVRREIHRALMSQGIE